MGPKGNLKCGDRLQCEGEPVPQEYGHGSISQLIKLARAQEELSGIGQGHST